MFKFPLLKFCKIMLHCSKKMCSPKISFMLLQHAMTWYDSKYVCVFQRGPPGPQGQPGLPGPSGTPGSDGIDVSIRAGWTGRFHHKGKHCAEEIPKSLRLLQYSSPADRGQRKRKQADTKRALFLAERGVFERGTLAWIHGLCHSNVIHLGYFQG